MLHKYFFTLFFIAVFASAQGQTAINNDGTSALPSAVLDIKNAAKGLLIPQISLTGTGDGSTIPTPTLSLLIYNNATTAGATAVTPGYYYWNGTGWIRLSSVLSNNSKSEWLLAGNAAAFSTASLGTKDNTPLNIKVNNRAAGRIEGAVRNGFWGYQSGAKSTGTDNNAYGYFAFANNTTGIKNTAAGSRSLMNNPGDNNTATGYSALNDVSNINNTALGSEALLFSNTGTYNTAAGAFTINFGTVGNYNTAAGYYALTSSGYFSTSPNDYNTAIGAQASIITRSASHIVAAGDSALYNNTAEENTAVGSRALFKNTTTTRNTAVGSLALYANTSGPENTAVGYGTLKANITGGNNTASGLNALALTTSYGGKNTATGNYALDANSTGTNNVAAGYFALTNTTAGTYNTAIGDAALSVNTTGSFNTAVGNNAGVSSNDLTNATAIGANALVDADNKIRIGSNTVTVIEGQVPFSIASDARFKYNIRHNVPGISFIKKLKPVTYNFNTEKLNAFVQSGVLNNNAIRASYTDGQRRTGFLAQGAASAAASLNYSFDGVQAPANEKEYYSVAYDQFIMPLVQAVQDQQQIIAALYLRLKKISPAEMAPAQAEKNKLQKEKIKAQEHQLIMLNKSLKKLEKATADLQAAKKNKS